jgi:hypothetical protein
MEPQKGAKSTKRKFQGLNIQLFEDSENIPIQFFVTISSKITIKGLRPI